MALILPPLCIYIYLNRGWRSRYILTPPPPVKIPMSASLESGSLVLNIGCRLSHLLHASQAFLSFIVVYIGRAAEMSLNLFLTCFPRVPTPVCPQHPPPTVTPYLSHYHSCQIHLLCCFFALKLYKHKYSWIVKIRNTSQVVCMP